ncbi:MAG TPA: alanine--tRNA ligase [Bacteroidota bacterium]|nr:alanine--tRNA ligase [Bacteroidota bacterium]
MTSQELRQSFLDFFASKHHRIVPSAPVIPHGDPTLLFTNAGMNQFKEVFLGTGTRDYKRAADTQKCIRVSGKHNDLEEVGRDTYHHTFFEMLGNWSFGDYYKKEAIEWAWELLTEVWKMPKNRLWVTVYKTDDEAMELWKTRTDVDPSHILKFAEKDNFWEMGETGPCGPCSEIHIDLTKDGNAPAELVNAGSPELIEIWNLVFIQNNRLPDRSLEMLPAKHVDTGMGFERACAVIESMRTNFKRPPSNYDTDVFLPLLSKISVLAQKKYTAGDSESDIAMRVIADHIRMLTFSIGDGAIPSNEGRGYVLRRILRRAARFGRKLEFQEPFLYKLVETLVATMSHVFPEIREQQSHIERVIKGEEEGFNRTLDHGLALFEEAVAEMNGSTVFPGDVAFKLYDTFGFPLDLTQLLCTERGLSVDTETFDVKMAAQKERSRESGTRFTQTVQGKSSILPSEPTEFLGYTELESKAHVIGVSEGSLILDRTPFYAESGGQVGDTGEIVTPQGVIPVSDTVKDHNVFIHLSDRALADLEGTEVTAKVDRERRLSIMRNHSATHLLHAALRKVLGNHVHQSGSLVAPNYLRFDFAHFAKVTDEEMREIEAIVNEMIAAQVPLQHHRAIPFAEAQKMGALMFFGDKYGERVNVVQFGDYTKEFCGGTHIANTGDIGFFKVRSESSSASGVRRIEALTGAHALDYLALQNKTYRERIEHAYALVDEIQSMQHSLPADSPLASEDTTGLDVEIRKLEQVPDVPRTVKTQELTQEFASQLARFRTLEEFILRLAEKKKAFEKESAKAKFSSAATDFETLVGSAPGIDSMKIVTAKMPVGDIDTLKSLGDALRSKLGSGVGVLAAVIDEKVQLVCVVTDDLIKSKNLSAGKIVGAVAKTLGGGGGGKNHMATAGGKDTAKLDEALSNVIEVVKGML